VCSGTELSGTIIYNMSISKTAETQTHSTRRLAMKKIVDKAPKNKIVPVEAPIILTPDQIALIAAGHTFSAEGGTATSGIVAKNR